MKIKLSQNSNRRCTFTDRKDGYIELPANKESESSGYFRGNKKFLSGFSANGHAFNEAKYINVFPYGIELDFSNANLFASLLIDEQAFFLSGTRNPGILSISSGTVSDKENENPYYSDKPEQNSKQTEEKESAEKNAANSAEKTAASENSTISAASEISMNSESSESSAKNPQPEKSDLSKTKLAEKNDKTENLNKNLSEKPNKSEKHLISYDWKKTEQNGIQILSSGNGIAVSAPFDFYYKINDDNLELYALDSKKFAKKINNFEKKLAEISSSPKDNFASSDLLEGWYLVFEDSNEIAVQKAVRLAKENAIKVHVNKIDEFLSKCKIDSGDKKFDEAFLWARFNAWLLATKDHDSDYRGIWAGLPWFRDNWGRDTFISLCGTLLVSGQFDEAKNVLLGFAGFQDLDKQSKTYGRIPNRYRNAEDVIYNTADGTLWFVRALWEYVQYSGDSDILNELSKTVEIALDADIARSDGNGFLKHGDADTWMDARIKGNEPWSPRGDRANDVQALWYTALKIGSYIMIKQNREDKAKVYDEMANKIKKSFEHFFWNKDCEALADHLPEGGYGEWAKDMRVRPNQLFAITAPSVLYENDLNDKNLVSDKMNKKILENVNRELVNPFGIFSLSPEDPIFHPEHENPTMHNKDAAYHNGTIWEWNSGPYISAVAFNSDGTLPQNASGIIQNEAKMILENGCAGSLSENIHARPDEDGNPKLSGTFSQAWSLAEFNRNIVQNITGFVPHLLDSAISLKPCLPANCKEWKALLPFGKNWFLKTEIVRHGKNYDCSAEWICGENENALPKLTLNGIEIVPNKKIEFKTQANNKKSDASNYRSVEKFGVPSKWIKDNFPKRELSPEWNGSEKIENYLENVILSGRMKSKTSGGENTACLEWFFDSEEFKHKYLTNEELGALYSKNSTIFKIWSPTAREVSVLLYPTGEDSSAEKIVPMKKLLEKDAATNKESWRGVWQAEVSGDLDGIYYEYKLLVFGVYNHCADPYAHAAGINGNRSMVCDLKKTNPSGWEKSSAPKISSPNDAIVWEAHVADITSSEHWNGTKEKQRLFVGAAEKGTSYNGMPTGFDYIKSLGITHVQLLPIFDFRSVDEKRTHDEEYRKKPTFGLFNWGYDPENYGLPEGSYSSNPYDGKVRIKELKELIMSLNNEGIGVVMDVVFNHVNDGLHHSLGISVPGYYFRVEGYSGAGEDTASEREMFRKNMVDMLCFWLKEYKLSGFRFDLMGLHDVTTMNEIDSALRKIKKDVLIYGEGWQMYNAGKMIPASMMNAYKMPGIGHFNDAFRCGIKGSVFDDKNKGFIHDGSHREAVKFGIVGATLHPQMEFSKVDGTANPNPWTQSTWTSVNYTEIHDNITLNDKLHLVEPNKSEEYYEQLEKMAISLILLSEGMPILHAGMEFGRTKEIPRDILESGAVFYDVANCENGKSYLRNSYNACDRINCLDWKRAYEKKNLVEYVKKLISLRKNHPAFRISSGKTLSEALKFLDNKKNLVPENLLLWNLDGKLVKDSWKNIIVAANPLGEDVPFSIPLSENENWFLVTNGIEFAENAETNSDFETNLIAEGKVVLKPKTVSVFATKQ